MLKKLLISLSKILAYLVFVGLAVYYTPKILSNALHTPYPLATITSGSMWPVLKVNDLVLMKGIKGNQAEIGQIIIFKHEGGFTIHRLIKKTGNTLTTKGDANNVEDRPFNENDVIGRVVYIGKSPFRIPYLGIIAKNLGPKLKELEKNYEG